MNHMLSLVVGGKLHQAPIGDDPQSILDLGTGELLVTLDSPESDAR
jgi:hypothetical protein